MIVKNEARVIRRCLDSVRPFIAHWIIVDTGSSDGTQQLIREYLADVPGAIHERAWRNFGHNRSEALELARGKGDYILVIDADEELVADPGFVLPALEHDEYLLLHRVAGSSVTFSRTTLIRAALPWRYEGVMHEHLACTEPHATGKLRGLAVRGHFDGARNVDSTKKYENDAQILEAALLEEPNNARYVFYLAQSYRDCGKLEQALETYARRATMGGWVEEVWYALFQVAVLGQRLGREWSSVLSAYLRAHQFRPTRAEPLCALAGQYRATQEWALAELFARAACAVPRPDDILFLDDSVYAWRVFDELAIAAYYMGKTEEALRLNTRLLNDLPLPDTERDRILKNLEFCRGRAQ